MRTPSVPEPLPRRRSRCAHAWPIGLRGVPEAIPDSPSLQVFSQLGGCLVIGADKHRLRRCQQHLGKPDFYFSTVGEGSVGKLTGLFLEDSRFTSLSRIGSDGPSCL